MRSRLEILVFVYQLSVDTPIFSQTTEQIWKWFRPLEFLFSTLSNDTGFAYPDLVENVNFD